MPIDVVKVIDASGSAIKGLKLVRTAPTHSGDSLLYHLASVGYDQRLSVWQVSVSASVSTEPSSAMQVVWRAGAMVNVSDVGAVDVLVRQQGDGASGVVCCVAGEGLQLFDIEL